MTKKEYKFKFESLWYCHETTAFDLGTDIETLTNKATESIEIPRWPSNGQKVKGEASSGLWLWESWKQHSEANSQRTQKGQSRAESFPMWLRKSQTAAPPVLLSTCLGSQISHKSSPVLGPTTAVYVLTGGFHSVPPLWWLWRVSVPSPQGHELLWVSVKLPHEKQRVGNITAKKLPDKMRKKWKWRMLYTVLIYNHYFNPAEAREKRSFLAMS